MDRIKALIIDDKRIMGDLFGYLLGPQHDITVAQRAEDALTLVRDQNFDVVFMDIIMPGKDGVQALEEIKTVKPELPVIMMSGYSVEEKKEEVKRLGAITCLDKPVAMDEVRRTVKLATGKEI